MATSAQKKLPIALNVGATVQFPITSSVNTKNPSYGESLRAIYQPKTKLGYTLSTSYLQNKGNVQIPVLAGVRTQLVKNVYVGAEAGVSFYTGVRSQFTYSPYVTAEFGRVSVTQNFLSTVSPNLGKSISSVGLVLSYRL